MATFPDQMVTKLKRTFVNDLIKVCVQQVMDASLIIDAWVAASSVMESTFAEISSRIRTKVEFKKLVPLVQPIQQHQTRQYRNNRTLHMMKL